MRPFPGSLLVLAILAAQGQAQTQARTHARHQAQAKPRPPVVLTPGALCARAIAEAEKSSNLPPGLLPAIALVESGRPDEGNGPVRPWPWTINAEGVGYVFPTKEDAVGAVQEFEARGVRSIDVGCMQVNLMHHPTAFPDLEAAFDPRANATYAGRFLTALYGQAGSWPVAAAFYHSQTPDLAEDYRHRVMAVWGQPDLAPPLVPGKAEPEDPKLAVYREFQPDAASLGAFTSKGQAYNEFAPAPPPPKRVLAARKPPARPARPDRLASLR